MVWPRLLVGSLILAMARELEDGHIQITALDPGRRETGKVTGYTDAPAMSALERKIEECFLDGELVRACKGYLAWGRIGSVGYRRLTSSEELSETGDEHIDTACASTVMARVVRDPDGLDGVIVDIRSNEGGWDDVGLEVAHWFAGPRALTHSKA